MIHSFFAIRSAVRDEVHRFRGNARRPHFEPLESRCLLSATVVEVDTFDDVVDPADGLISLREAVLEANASPDDYDILLSAGTYALSIAGSGEDASLTGDLDVTAGGSLKVVGEGAATTTIDASAVGDRIFDVLAGAVFEVTSVTLSGAQAGTSAGGAVNNFGGQATITGVLVSGNSAGDGGGIHNDGGGQVIVAASTLADNFAASNGGGIANFGGQLTVINSTLSGNTANAFGGAVANAAQLAVLHSTITDNFADVNQSGTGAGGALYAFAGTSALHHTLVVSNGRSPNANQNIYVVSQIEPSNSLIDSASSYNLVNTLETTGGLTDGVNGNIVDRPPFFGIFRTGLADNGGPTPTYALLRTGPAVNAGDPDFDPNAVTPPLLNDQRGTGFPRVSLGRIDIGALEGLAEPEPVDGVIVVDLFEDVVAFDGLWSLREAIAFANTSSEDLEIRLSAGTYPLIDQSILAGGSTKIVGDGAAATTIVAKQPRGVIFTVESTAELELEGLTLTGVDDEFGSHSRALRNLGGSLAVINAAVTGNVARSDGTAIYNSEGGIVTIMGSTISDNVTTSFSGGGVIHNVDGQLTISDSTLSGNTSREAGGAVFNASGGRLTITDSTLSENTSVDSGGAVYNTGIVTIFDSTVSNNAATRDGGGIYHERGLLTITNTNVSDNSARSGGGIYMDGGEVTITDSTLLANSASSRDASGGAVYNANSQLTINHSTLAGNTATSSSTFFRDGARGGAIYGPVRISHSTLANNVVTNVAATSNARGGAIYSVGGVTITETSFTGNTASWGGAVYHTGSSLTISGSTLSDNIANNGGGAMYNDQFSRLAIVDSGIVRNSAGSDGGAILNTGTDARLEISASQLAENSATYGGGIYNTSGAEVVLADSTISDGSASISGGGVFNADNARLTIVRSTLWGNSAKADGGAIFNATAAELTMINSTLSGNAANSFGGAIHNIFGGGQVTVRHSTVTANLADADDNGFGAGGGLYIAAGTTAALDHTIVAGNLRGPAQSRTASDIEADATDPVDPASSYNLVGDPDTAGGLAHGANGNIVGDGLGNLLSTVQVLDLNLSDHGGPTRTHAVTFDSPALNAGDPLFDPNAFDPPLLNDQRGPGFARVNEGRIDIGAYEGTPNPEPVDGVIVVDVFEDSRAADGLWSLREAIIHANTHPGDFEIHLLAGTYPLTIKDPIGFTREDAAVTGDLDILDNGSLRIIGSGAETTTIDAGFRDAQTQGVGGIFAVHGAIAQFEGLTLTGGVGIYGAAIGNLRGRVMITDSIVSQNLGAVGAILNHLDSQMTITDTTIAENGELGLVSGGGVSNFGAMTITGSTISNNRADRGGGILNWSGGQLTLSDSTVSDNRAGEGGGISNGGQMTIRNTSISGSLEGGGINNYGNLSVIDTIVSENFGFGFRNAGISNFATATIAGSTISGHRVAGLFNSGTLSIFDSTISDNESSSSSSRGGGGLQNTGTATITRSTFSDNFGRREGGAIFNDADAVLTVTASTLSGNTAASGGAIYNDGGTATIFSSTLSANTATGDHGGGIYNATGGNLTAINSTFSGNAAKSFGGGIFSFSSFSRVTVRHSTITGNVADADGGGFYTAAGSLITLDHTIVAGNFRGPPQLRTPSDVGTDTAVQLTTASRFNLIGDPASAGGLTHGTNGNIVGDGQGNLLPTALILDTTLADNGGPTLTHAITIDSPALNAGDPLFDPTAFDPPLLHDQRGPGFARVNEGRVDIGAYEGVPNPTVVDGIIVVDVFEDSRAADGLWSLREAIIHANMHPGDFEIRLSVGTYSLTIQDQNQFTDEDAAVTGDLDILDNGSLRIVGTDAEATTIDAGFRDAEMRGADSRIFDIREAVAHFEGLTLTGGIEGSGGAIRNVGGRVMIAASIVTQNLAAVGAIHNYFDSQMVISDTIVSENGKSEAEHGGGVANWGTMTITGSMILANFALSGGGLWSDYDAQLTLVDSTVSENRAAEGSGILNAGTITVIDSAIFNNVSATHQGGGVENTGTASIIGSTISGNQGGGITNRGILSVVDSMISNNIGQSGLVNEGTATITRSTFSGNRGSRGGAIFNHADSTLTVTASTIFNNNAAGGGGIYNRGIATIASSALEGNTAARGGGIENEGALTLAGSTLSGNSALREGGGIYNAQHSIAALVSSTLEANSADDGGGIHNFGSVIVFGSTLSANTAIGRGGGIYNASAQFSGTIDSLATLTLSGSTLSDNRAESLGGGIYNGAGGLTTLDDATVSANAARIDGGGIYNIGDATIFSSTLSANTARAHGGGIYNAFGGTAALSDSTLWGNTARVDGGGLANRGTAEITGTTLSNNMAEHFGGGILNLGRAEIINSTISGNAANSIGGGIAGGGELTVRHSTITGNRSDADGDGVGPGGGLALFNGAVLQHTIVAGNLFGATPGGVPSDIMAAHGLAVSSRFNLVGDPNSSGGLVHGAEGNIVGDGLGNPLDVNTVLDTTLANNGGPTLTHGLVMNSPAIDAGDANFAPPPNTDQRGFMRLVGERIDIGAYEAQMGGADAPAQLVARGSLNRTAGLFLQRQLRFPDPWGQPANFVRQVNRFVGHGLLATTDGQLLIDAAEGLGDSWLPSARAAATDSAFAQFADELADDAMLLEVDVATVSEE